MSGGIVVMHDLDLGVVRGEYEHPPVTNLDFSGCHCYSKEYK
jgi:hypothetical protein